MKSSTKRKYEVVASRGDLLSMVRHRAAETRGIPTLLAAAIPNDVKDVTMEFGPLGLSIVWSREENSAE